MGCDIHSFAEVKRNEKWVKVEEEIFPSGYTDEKTNEPFSWRSYAMFGYFCDCVRGGHEKGFEMKSLPYDSEYLNNTIDDNWYGHANTIIRDSIVDDPDYHSQSYLTLGELLSNPEVNQEFGPLFNETLDVLKELGQPEDVRIVFWFDN